MSTKPYQTPLERARTKEALTLFLYNPIPGFALVCFDDPNKDPPKSFQRIVDDLGDKRQRLDPQFIMCSSTFDDGSPEVDQGDGPTYVLFRCGGDFQELGRMSASRDEDHFGTLYSFVVRKTGASINDKGETLLQKFGMERTKKRLSGFLAHMSKRHKVDLRMDADGKATVYFGAYAVTIYAAGRGGGMCHLVSFLGNEKHDDDAGLLKEVLQWNYGENFVGEYNIGADPKSKRFSLECFLHNLDENGWNEVNFNNLVCDFGNTCKIIDQKIKEFKKKSKEKNEPQEKKPSPEELRRRRLSALLGKSKCRQRFRTDKKPLPKGWTRTYSFSRKRYFYSHKGTKHKQWHFPRPSEVSDPYMAKCRTDNKNGRRQHKKRPAEITPSPSSCSPVPPPLDASVSKKAKISNDDPDVACGTRKKKLKFAGLTAERREMMRHREILRKLIQQDKLERKRNGGKLKTKLGIDGFRPTGTHYDIDR